MRARRTGWARTTLEINVTKKLDPIREMTTKDDKGTPHQMSRDVLVRAFIEWTRGREALNYGALGYRIDEQMGKVWEGNWNFGRAADRMCQNLRKAGWIAKADKGRGWQLTEKGTNARNDLQREIATDA